MSQAVLVDGGSIGAGCADVYGYVMPIRLRSDCFKECRVRAGLTQEGLAEESGRSRSAIAKIETDLRQNTDLESLDVWAAAMGCGEHELIGFCHPPDADLPPEARAAIRAFYEVVASGVNPRQALERITSMLELLRSSM